MPTVEQVKEKLTPVFDSHGVRRAVLFGSVAKGTANERSDVDLLVDSNLKGLRFVGLMEAARAALLLPVDMMDVTHIEKESRIDREIRETGVVIYGNQ